MDDKQRTLGALACAPVGGHSPAVHLLTVGSLGSSRMN